MGVIGEVAAERHDGRYDAERRNEGSAAWETRPTRGGERVCSRNLCQETPRDKSTKRTPPRGEQSGRRGGVGVIGEVAAERHDGHYDAERRNEGRRRRGRRARRAGANASVPVTLTRKGRATNLQNELPPVARRADGAEARVSSLRSPGSGTMGVTTQSVGTRGARRWRRARRAGANASVPVTLTRKGRATNLQNELPPSGEQSGGRRGCHR